MKTRILYTKIWHDTWFADLTPIEKLIFLYYLLNETVNIIHLYECSDRKVIYETGVTMDELARAKTKFEAADRIYFYKGYVYLKNASKYEKYSGLAEQGKQTIINQLNDDIFTWYVKVKSPLDAPLKGTNNNKQETINNKQITINNNTVLDIDTRTVGEGYKRAKAMRDQLVKQIKTAKN